eukprot:Nk52_evm1s202 gene=Nk52_evmTU1s202
MMYALKQTTYGKSASLLRSSGIAAKVLAEKIEAVPSPIVSMADWMRRKIVRDDMEDAFYVANMGKVESQYRKWNRLLPAVDPFYAVKCNDDDVIVSKLMELGAGFDCASKGEIEKVLRLGGSPERIVFANPCKQASHIKYARKHGVDRMTFDNEDELFKVKKLFPEAKMILRILPDDSRSVCRLGLKFGASLDRVPNLLKTANELDLDVIGVSFHVGSGCFDATAFSDAVVLARRAFDIGRKMGYEFEMLDIGGGFPGHKDPKSAAFEDICHELNSALTEYFPPEEFPKLRSLIAEPGRYFACAAYTLATSVIAKRVEREDSKDSGALYCDASFGQQDASAVSHQQRQMHHQVQQLNPYGRYGISANDQPCFMYYVNDGVYGSFNNLLYDHAEADPHVLMLSSEENSLDAVNEDGDDVDEIVSVAAGGRRHYHHATHHRSIEEPSFRSSLWGPTCDGLDCLKTDYQMPELNVGSWLYFPNMGAYTRAAASPFNGFDIPDVHYVDTTPEDEIAGN